MPERLQAIVHGYVQGVGYRAFAAREGRRLGLAGSVWNRADGAVEVVAEGERAALEELLQALRRGPGEAEVEQVQPQWGRAEGIPAGFLIRW
jgi:acylphosphatase